MTSPASKPNRTIAQPRLHRIANDLQRLEPLLRKPGAKALDLAADWDGMVAAAGTEPGSRSTEHNDLSRRVGQGPDPEYLGAYQRMSAALVALEALDIPGLIRDFEYCQAAKRIKDADTNKLARLNSKTGECEACYTAGRDDSYQHGTLEAVVTGRTTTSTDADTQHEQLDLCHKCAVSARGSRVNATTRGEEWDHEAWMAQRVERLTRTAA